MPKSSPSRRRSLAVAVIAVTALTGLPMVGTAATDNPWTGVPAGSATALSAGQPEIQTARFAGFTLDHAGMASTLDRIVTTAGSGEVL